MNEFSVEFSENGWEYTGILKIIWGTSNDGFRNLLE